MPDLEAGKTSSVSHPSKVKVESSNDCCSIICAIFVSVIGTCIMLTISILDLTFANIYADTSVCVKNNVVTTDYLYNPITWLNVSGGAGIALTFFVIVSFMCMRTENRAIGVSCSSCIVCLGQLFAGCWIVVGIVMFARDCPQMYPNTLFNYFIASLICNFIVGKIRIAFCSYLVGEATTNI